MSVEFITIKKVLKTGTNSVVVRRDKLFSLMEGIRVNFSDNNEVSTRLVELIPKVSEIIINEVRNPQLDVPFVRLVMLDGKSKVVRIPRCHKIIWAIFDEFTK